MWQGTLRCFKLPLAFLRWLCRLGGRWPNLLFKRMADEPSPTAAVIAPVAIPRDVAAPSEVVIKGNRGAHQKPRSPCFIATAFAPPSFDAACDSDMEALAECQHLLIDKHCSLVQNGVLPVDVPPLESGKEEPIIYHPIQDPTGALIAALLVVRRNRPGKHAFSHRHGQPRSICKETRLALSAILSVCHKFVSHTARFTRMSYVEHLLRAFLLPLELPIYESDWEIAATRYMQQEAAVLDEPLYTLMVDNPLAEVEALLCDLVFHNVISEGTSAVMRGSAFFIIGACLCNPTEVVMEDLAQQINIPQIGQGCVRLLLVLHYALCTAHSTSLPRLKRSRSSELPASLYGEAAEKAALCMLKNAASLHAMALRIGPYRSVNRAFERGHPVQELVSPANIERASALFAAAANAAAFSSDPK